MYDESTPWERGLEKQLTEVSERLAKAEALLRRCRQTNAIRMVEIYAELKAGIDSFLEDK